jgi:hypothetical protein
MSANGRGRMKNFSFKGQCGRLASSVGQLQAQFGAERPRLAARLDGRVHRPSGWL